MIKANSLKSTIDKSLLEIQAALYEKVARWSSIRMPVEMLNLEQELQSIVGKLASKIVGHVVEAIHLDLDFVVSCQKKALIGGLRNVEWRWVSIETLGGGQIAIYTPYAARKRERVGRPRKKRSVGGSGDYPVLRRLGIVARATPALLAEVNLQVAEGPSEKEVQLRLNSRSIMLDTKTIRRYIRDFGGIALWQRQAAAANLEKVQAIKSAPLTGKRVVLATDGGRLRFRVNKKGRRKKSGRHGFYTPWREPKLFVIYTIDQQGGKEQKGQMLYNGTLSPADECFQLISYQLKYLGIEQAQSLTVLGDGASWIWKRVPLLINRLDLSIPVVEILDFRHAVEKTVTAAKASSLNEIQVKSWVKRIRRLLKKSQIDKVIEALESLNHSNYSSKEIRLAISYCQTHRQRLQYADFIKQGLPIGSGAIESGIRRIVNLRLKGPGIFWLDENAERILHLRCQAKSGHWPHFVESVLTQWASNFAVSLAQVNSEI